MKNNNPDWIDFSQFDQNIELFPADMIYSIHTYRKNELIFRQGDVCEALHILIQGSVKTEMITENGNLLGIETIKAPRPLAPAFLFSDNNCFPVDVRALEDIEVLRMPKNEVLKLMTSQPDFMKQFLTYNANRTQFLINRLKLLSIKTIKGKIAYFLIEKYAELGLKFEINKNQTELAAIFGVTRPSLARSLSELIQDEILIVNKKKFTILKIKELQNLLN